VTRKPDSTLAHIGHDLDGVHYPYAEGFWHTLRVIGHPMANETPPPPEGPDRWYFHRAYGMSDGDFHAITDIGADLGTIYGSAPPFPRAREAMNLLYDLGHRTTIITARDDGTNPGRVEDTTRRWLDRWGFRYDDLVFHHDKTVVPTDVFIEDRIDNYDALEAAGIRAVLHTRPYNADPTCTRLRVDSVYEFAHLVAGTPAEQAHMIGAAS
jgi:hypothetical protein